MQVVRLPINLAIVGAGMGGLATALRLSHLGCGVTVLEKTDQVGGRNRLVQAGECQFDGGPTLLMMLEPLHRLFNDVGERLEDHLDLSLCDPGYRVFYADGSRIDGTPNVDRMVEQIRALSGSDDAAAYPRMLRELEALYEDAIPNFVAKNFYGPWDFFGGKSLALVARHGMLNNFARRMGRYYKDPRLRMLFSFQSMYLGLSPFRAPWVYATLTYMEYGQGIWYSRGGLVELGRVLAGLAEKRGAYIRLSTTVRRIMDKSVETEAGERIEADAVVCNADLPYAMRELIKVPSRRRLRYSCSAYMLYIDYKGRLPDMLHHNVFFGSDFRGNLEDIFTRARLPEDPAFYACISGRTDPSRAPDGHENLSILVPCPNLEHAWSESDGEQLRTAVFERLARECRFEPERIAAMKSFSPCDWNTQLNLDRGAAFGLSHDFLQSAYFRPSNWSRNHPSVYFVGAGTAPGNGLPMVLISAELAESRMRRDGIIG